MDDLKKDIPAKGISREIVEQESQPEYTHEDMAGKGHVYV
jgi:hypothetical protein